jgi:sugar/nucleoside kinase (ribokinase family)
MKILCVGQMVADILVQGINTLDFSIDTRRVDDISVKNGGDCLNTAINLKRLGNEIGFAGLVGNDTLGRYLLEVLKENHIENKGVRITDEAKTSSVIVAVNPKGERVFFYYGGTNDLFSFDDLNPAEINQFDIIHVGGAFLLPRFDGDGAAKLFELAHQSGKLTTMDVTWDTVGRWMQTIEPCLKHLDLFMPSIGEAEKITGETHPENMANVLMEKGVKNVIIKLGKKGCYINAFGERFYFPAYDVPVVDTTGAGDSFVSGILTGISKGWNIGKSVQFASAVSAFCIQTLGATTGIPSFEEVINFIDTHKHTGGELWTA